MHAMKLPARVGLHSMQIRSPDEWANAFFDFGPTHAWNRSPAAGQLLETAMQCCEKRR